MRVAVQIEPRNVLTSFIYSSPALFEQYINNSQPAVDEWTLSEAMAADTARGGIKQLEDHYKTFIVSYSYDPLYIIKHP